MKNNKKVTAAILSAVLFFNTMSFARPVIGFDDGIDPNNPPIVIRPRDGQPYCQSGCGKYRDPGGRGDGRGTGQGEGRGTGGDHESTRSIPSVGAGGGNKEKNQDERPRGRDSHGEGPFGGWDRSNRETSQDQAWQNYREQIQVLNEKWTAELEKRYQSEQTNSDVAAKLVDEWASAGFPNIQASSAPPKTIDALITASLPQQFQGYQYLKYKAEDFKSLLDYQYQSHQKAELNKIRSDHADFKPQSPQAYNAYKAGLNALINADNAYIINDEQTGTFYKESAKVLLDVATDIIPITSIPKDLYRLFVGKDPFSGSEIPAFDRLMAGGFVFLTVASAGTLSFMRGLREAKVIAKATAEQARVAETFFESAKGLERLRWGTWSDLSKVIIDGREYAQIGERLYTKHAIDRMVPKALGSAVGGVSGRGVPTMVVEATIATGEKIATQVLAKGSIRETWKLGNVQVITENSGRLVVTVMRIGG